MAKSTADMRGTFVFDRESVVMRKWQILEFDGKPYYAFVPENDSPLTADDIPDFDGSEIGGNDRVSRRDASLTDDDMEDEESLYNYDMDNFHGMSEDEGSSQERETKPIVINGNRDQNGVDPTVTGNFYQVKVEDGMVTLERLHENLDVTEKSQKLPLVKQEPPLVLSESDANETLMEMPEEEEDEEQEEGEDAEEHVVEAIAEEIDEDDDEEAQESITGTYVPSRSRIAPRSNRSSTMPKVTSGPLKCKACTETFGSAIAFRKHVAWTHKKKVCIQEDGAYICAVCDYRTLKKSLFAAHLERKHETWTRKRESSLLFPCEACGFTCRSKHSLQSHFIRKHTDTYEHVCEFCEKKFKVKGDLTNHVRFHHKEKPIKCDVCGKLCQNTGSLYVHQKWAHYKPKFECHICKRRMVTQENLDQHLVTQHEQREKIVCAQCGKTFTKKDSFKRHMAVHTGSKPHSCPICTKPFARQSQLRQHVLIHTGQRPFICDICGKGFTQKPGLICHRKTHPGPLPPLPVMPIADLVRQFIAQNEESQSQDNELECVNDDQMSND